MIRKEYLWVIRRTMAIVHIDVGFASGLRPNRMGNSRFMYAVPFRLHIPDSQSGLCKISHEVYLL